MSNTTGEALKLLNEAKEYRKICFIVVKSREERSMYVNMAKTFNITNVIPIRKGEYLAKFAKDGRKAFFDY